MRNRESSSSVAFTSRYRHPAGAREKAAVPVPRVRGQGLRRGVDISEGRRAAMRPGLARILEQPDQAARRGDDRDGNAQPLGAVADRKARQMPFLRYFMTAEMKLFTSASGVLQLFIHDTVVRLRSCVYRRSSRNLSFSVVRISDPLKNAS